MYLRRSHFIGSSSDGLNPDFAHDLPALKITELSDVSRPTINQLIQTTDPNRSAL